MKPRSRQDVLELLAPEAKLMVVFAQDDSAWFVVERILDLRQAVSIADRDRRRLERALRRRIWDGPEPAARQVKITLAGHLHGPPYDCFLANLAAELYEGLEDIYEVPVKRRLPITLALAD